MPNEEAMKIKLSKLRWRLVPWKQLESTVKVFDDGATKYGENNWKTLDRSIFEDALARHTAAYLGGELTDKESGSPHTAHIAANAMFLGWFDQQGVESESTV